MVDVVPAEVRHAEALAGDLRPEDAAEVAATGETAREALLRSLASSDYARAAIDEDGNVLAVWGTTPLTLLGGVATVWLLTGRAVERHKLSMLRIARRELKFMHARFFCLGNMIDERYARALKFVSALGFDLAAEPAEFGANGEPFRAAWSWR